MPKRAHRAYPTNYPTHLTDDQWIRIAPLVTQPQPRSGRPCEIDLRAVMHARIYKNRTGRQWRRIPADFPPIRAIQYYFDTWTTHGTFVKINDVVRKAARKALGRDEEPSISIIDSQSTKTTEVGGERGIDGGKKVNGRKPSYTMSAHASDSCGRGL